VRRFETDVSKLLIGPIIESQAVQEIQLGALNIAPIGGPETSVSNFLTLRNKPEEGRIHSQKYLHLNTNKGYFI
jgi:hypothetical protein